MCSFIKSWRPADAVRFKVIITKSLFRGEYALLVMILLQQFINYHSNHSSGHMQIFCRHKRKTLCISPSQGFFLFHMILTNSDFCHPQYFLVGLSNGNCLCLLWHRLILYGSTHCYHVSHCQLRHSKETDSPPRLQMPSADAINLLWVQAPERHPTYLLLLCSQPRWEKCSSKQSLIYSHRDSLPQTQWCHQCTRVAKGTKGFGLDFRASFGP